MLFRGRGDVDIADGIVGGTEICMFTAPAGNWGVVRSLSLTIEFASKLAGILPKFLPCRGGSVRPRSGLERGGIRPRHDYAEVQADFPHLYADAEAP